MIFRNPVTWRFSHSRHHTDTAIVGRDPEIAATRPPNLKRMALNVFGVIDFYEGLKQMLSLFFDRMSAEVQSYVSYQKLPALHEKIKHDLPAANPSIWHALKETYPVLVKQAGDPDLFLIRELPETARGYQTIDSIKPEVVDVR